METYLTEIKVFLGSPSDLVEERQKFRDIIAYVNKWAYLSRIQFAARSSDDLSPDVGHAQDLINERVFRDCKIFALLLWKKWGTPTKRYSSGFEEEYETARALKAEDNEIRISLYFRDIPSYMLNEPDRELERVLAFREKAKDECFYKTYENVDEWAKLLEENLRDWLNQPRILKRTARALMEEK
jgi:hypothetical protein